MSFEGSLHHSAVNAAAPAMNEPNLTEPRRHCRIDVFDHDRLDVRRRERVEIELRLDGDANWLVERHGAR